MNTASCKSAVTFIDGDEGILEYRGYPIEQLAEKSTFLEVAYLLVHGELPTKTQYESWVHDITYHTFVHENVKSFMEGFRYDAHPMGMLMASVGALSTFYPDARDIDDDEIRQLQIVRMIAKMPTLGAWSFRHAQGKPFVYPDNELGYTANFLSMLFRMSEDRFAADERLVKALDVLFILHADHEQNCSTNAVRSIGSSQVDPYSAVAGGVGALYGPLHGGANEAVLRMLRRIKDKENIPDFIEGVKNGDERLMGFGHRVYKNYDPRAKIIKKACDDVFEVTGVNPLLEIAMELEKIALEDEYFVSRKLYPNVDFYSGLIYEALPVPAGDVHGAVRDRAYAGLAGPVARARAGQGAEDRPAQADLHRPAHPRLRARLRALGLSGPVVRRSTSRPCAGFAGSARGRDSTLDLEQRLGVPLGLERRAATAEAEEPLGPQDVDHGEHVERERHDPEPGDPLEELVDLQRDEDRGADDRDVLAPALHQPEPDGLEQLQCAVRQDAEADQGERVGVGSSAFWISSHRAGRLQVDAGVSATGDSRGR